MIQINLLLQDSHTCLVIRRGDISNKTPFKTCTESGFKCLYISRWLIAGDNDLLAGSMQMVKCMEKFFLCTFFSDNELDIIDEKNIDVTIFLTEFGHGRLIS